MLELADAPVARLDLVAQVFPDRKGFSDSAIRWTGYCVLLRVAQC